MELKKGLLPLLIAAALWVAIAKIFIGPSVACSGACGSGAADFAASPDFVRETVEEIRKLVASNIR